MIFDRESYPVVAQTRRQRRARGQRERALHEWAELGDVLELIERARRVRGSGIPRSIEVIEVPAIVALSLEVDAGGQPLRERSDAPGIRNAGPDAVVEAREIDVGRGERVFQIPAHAEDGECRFPAVRHRIAHRRSDLQLADVLSSIAIGIRDRDCVAVGVQLGECQRSGVLGTRRVPVVRDDRERPPGGKRQLQTRVQHSQIGGAMVTLSFVVEARGSHLRAATADAKSRRRLPLIPRPVGSLSRPARDEPDDSAGTSARSRGTHSPDQCRRHRAWNGAKNTNTPGRLPRGVREKFGGDLLSQGVYPQVPSALAVLTSVFGMGTGVTLPL